MPILVIHPHPLIQEALRLVLRDVAPDAPCIAGDTFERVTARCVAGEPLAMAILDVTAGGEPALALVRAVRERHPGTPIVVASSGAIDVSLVLAAARAGAVGFIAMAHDVVAIRRTLGEVLRDGAAAVCAPGVCAPAVGSTSAPSVPATPTILARPAAPDTPMAFVAGALPRTLPVPAAAFVRNAATPAAGPGDAVDAAQRLGLTPRQSEVLALLVRGLSNKLIGRELQLSPSTVKIHVSAVLRALHARSRTEAVIAAAAQGIVPPQAAGPVARPPREAVPSLFVRRTPSGPLRRLPLVSRIALVA